MEKEHPSSEELARELCRRRREGIEALSGIRHRDVDFAFLSQTLGQRSRPQPASDPTKWQHELVTSAEMKVIEEAIRRTEKDGGITTIAVLLLCMMPTLIAMAMALFVWLYVL